MKNSHSISPRVLAFNNFILEALDKYPLISFIVLSIFIWAIIIFCLETKKILQKDTLGDLLFKTQKISPLNFLGFLMIIIPLFMVRYYVLVLMGQGIFPLTLIDAIAYKTGIKLYCIVQILTFLSAGICLFVMFWQRLEIRENGICYVDKINWQNINSYYWSGRKNNILVLEYFDNKKNTKNKILKIIVDRREKEQVEDLFQNKLKSNTV